MRLPLVSIPFALMLQAVMAVGDSCTRINALAIYGDSLSSPGFSDMKNGGIYYGQILASVFGARLFQGARGGATTCRRGCPLLMRLLAGKPVEQQVR